MNALNAFSNFFGNPIFNIIGGISVCTMIIGIIYRIFFWAFGITPIMFRLGMALWKRNVAVFGDDHAFGILRSTLLDSSVFKSKNIIHIRAEELDKAKTENLFVVDWESFSQQIELIFALRPTAQTPIIIFSKPGMIPQDQMGIIANRPNTVVVNFRGRLLNDILTSLITTSYEKK